MKRLSLLLIFFIFPLQLYSDLSAPIPAVFQYIYPSPGADYVPVQSPVIVRFAKMSPSEVINLSALFRIIGHKSGDHSGRTEIASNRNTVIFHPDSDFLPGERVIVTLMPQLDSGTYKIEPFTFEFTTGVSKPGDNISLPEEIPASHSYRFLNNQPAVMENGVSVPSDFPYVDITAYNNPDTGYIFLNNWGPPNYNIIFENTGAPVWYWRTPDNRRDFKVQKNGWLSMMIRDGYGGTGWGFIALDSNYQYIKTFRAVAGYNTDEHELQVLPDSGYLLIGRREEVVDMSQYVAGGRTDAIVRETCIQEFTADDQLIFIWRAWDHFDIRDLEIEDLTSGYIRFPHMNAIDIDDDGHILLSSRHLSEITKINRQTGDIIWRMTGTPGSPDNDLQFVDDPLNGFRNQHSIRSLGNGHYTLFDNGNLHTPPLSRAVEYAIDTVQMTATLVWEYRNQQPQFNSYYMGNVQRLANGNTFINWAVGDVLPIAQEIRPDGMKAFEMSFVKGYHCYRSFRFPWSGQATVPYLIVEPRPDQVTFVMNKFGDRTVDFYKIYGDTFSPPVTLLDTSRSTLKGLTNLLNGRHYYFRVTAVDSTGNESGFSNEQNVTVNLIEPGQNMVLNGDFSLGRTSWEWDVNGSAWATWNVQDSIFHFDITNGGSAVYNIQLRQAGIPLLEGTEYTLEFDAWADAPRFIEVKVGQSSDPWINYSRLGFTYVTSTPFHFRHTFEMQDPSDFNTRVEVNTGNSNVDVYIDNVTLVMEPQTGIVKGQLPTEKYHLYPNFPNPFNPATTIRFSLPVSSQVSIRIINILGEEMVRLVDDAMSPGEHRFQLDGSNLASGVYFCVMNAKSLNSSIKFRDVKKIFLIR